MSSTGPANGHHEFPDGDHAPSAPHTAPPVRPSSGDPLVPHAPHLRHIWVVTGPAGCGKSTVAQYLSAACQLPYVEGDDFHPKANIDKMSHGIPLTDEDRWGWLETLRQKGMDDARGPQRGCVITCSCLKKRYRDVLRKVEDDEVKVGFVYLAASEETLLERVRARKGHYMKDDMVHSQFAALEEPGEDEPDVIMVDCSKSPEEVERAALEEVRKRMRGD